MTVSNLSRALLLAILPAMIGGSARAVDIRFEVPVELYNLDPKIKRLGVRCLVKKTGQELGQSNVFFPIPSTGNFSGTIIVDVDLHPGVKMQDVTRYDCRMMRTSTLSLWDCSKPGPKFREECRRMPTAPWRVGETGGMSQ